ncbi:uncharacterized protein PpBr36_06683 [Pyricularia pennisetigena]|uniref:uncharacterized protein n=1 Tax=Pyricularia pennisetigena TaxID=1578925 RepID=UPI00115403CB|nr:uncharacterized protein PpBr36_06683 [Pyricularia pennisetigena]TLS23423.1 hypothetical protein PpBr36_06683 [Pyricularia pennisetigena]
MHPVPTDEPMLPMIDGLIYDLISGPFDGISKQCNSVSLPSTTENRYCFSVAMAARQIMEPTWINGTANPDSPLKTAWRRMGRTWVECLSAKKLAGAMQ